MSYEQLHSLPEGWKEKELEELIASRTKITYGVVQPGEQDPNGVPFIRGGDINNGKIAIGKLRKISRDVSASYKRTLLRGGELLMSLVGYPGEVAIVPESLAGANIARQAAYIKLGQLVDSKYVMYYLQSDLGKYYLFQKLTGSAQQVINLVDLKEVRVVFPPLPEQKKIAAILTSVDDVIEKTQAQIDKLKDLKAGMMQELLTRGVGVDGMPHKEFKDSPVGRIPKSWEVVKLGDKASLIPGFAFKSTDFVANGVPLIRMGNLYNNKLDLTRAPKYLPSDYIDKHPKFAVGESDIVFSMTGTSGKEDYGFAVQVPNGTKPCLLNQRVAKVIAGENAVNNYLLHLMRSRLFLDEIYSVGTGTKQANLSSANILNVVLPFPSLGEQTAISKVLDSIDDRVLVVAKKLEKLKLKKKALMQDLLTGKVRVKVDS
ncbi:TPA: restriction endonuclease subunit S [Vibrio parahaemolyticus]